MVCRKRSKELNNVSLFKNILKGASIVLSGFSHRKY